MINKALFSVCLLCQVILLIFVYYFESNDRFLIVRGDGLDLKIDKRTGQVSEFARRFGGGLGFEAMITADNIQDQDTWWGSSLFRKKLVLLPDEELKKLTGRAGPTHVHFGGSIYNGTLWMIDELVLNLTAKKIGKDIDKGKDKDDQIIWSRDFLINVKISPLRVGRFIIPITGEGDVTIDWDIKSAKGYSTVSVQ